MQRLPEIIRRNRTVILMFTLLVIMPLVLLGIVAFRAIRSDEAEQRFRQRNRQREILALFEPDLKHWLFSDQPDNAASKALLKFTVDGDRVLIPDLDGYLPHRPTNRLPVDSPTGVPDKREIRDVYYPRIEVFIRDFNLRQNSGAQYFRRLKAMIVKIPGTATGYVLSSAELMEFATRRLDDISSAENFQAVLRIAEAGEPALGGEEVVSLHDFTFFHIAFTPKGYVESGVRRSIVLYWFVPLALMSVLAGLFLYRAISSEMAVAQLRADFVAAVSHEFRTPLSSMLALLERLEAGHVVEKEMLQRYHQTLRREAGRLTLLVDKLLDFAQLEEGKWKFSFETVLLQDVVSDAIQSVLQSIPGRRIETESPPSAEGTYVLGDRTAITQCVQNLIENALKYSPAESYVLVRTAVEHDFPFVEVVDYGIGIPAAEHRKIFDKFYRAENGRALNVQGTGIGLALVQRIMERHGGSVTVDSTLGKGSCFRLVFAKQESER